MERRLQTRGPAAPLPADYLKLVTEVFNTNFDDGLKRLSAHNPGAKFEADGSMYGDEIVLAITLAFDDQLAATTLYASMDFDPKASAPTIQDILAICVDAVAATLETLIGAEATPTAIEALAEQSLAAFENVPFDWTSANIDKKKVWLKLDKANPKLDKMADDWLEKNDPDYAERLEREQKETEKLFVTGPKKDDGSDTVH